MDLELREAGWAEGGEGVPFLLGLMISLSLSFGLWVMAWWIGCLISR